MRAISWTPLLGPTRDGRGSHVEPALVPSSQGVILKAFAGPVPGAGLADAPRRSGPGAGRSSVQPQPVIQTGKELLLICSTPAARLDPAQTG